GCGDGRCAVVWVVAGDPPGRVLHSMMPSTPWRGVGGAGGPVVGGPLLLVVEVAVPSRSSAPGHDAFPIPHPDEFPNRRVGPTSTTTQLERLAGGRVAVHLPPGAVAVGHDLPRHRSRDGTVAVEFAAAVGLRQRGV